MTAALHRGSALRRYQLDVGKDLPAIAVQVHSQKANLGGHIAISEAVVEFDAIVNADGVSETDMGSMKVAMTVPYSAFSTLFKQPALFP